MKTMSLMGTPMIFIFLLMCCDSIPPVVGDGEDNVSDGDSNDIYLYVDVDRFYSACCRRW